MCFIVNKHQKCFSLPSNTTVAPSQRAGDSEEKESKPTFTFQQWTCNFYALASLETEPFLLPAVLSDCDAPDFRRRTETENHAGFQNNGMMHQTHPSKMKAATNH